MNELDRLFTRQEIDTLISSLWHNAYYTVHCVLSEDNEVSVRASYDMCNIRKLLIKFMPDSALSIDRHIDEIFKYAKGGESDEK